MHIPEILFIGNLFSSDMLIILVVALMLFGGEKLPEIARGLGKGIRDFKDASEGIKREINDQINNFEEKKEEKKIEAAIAANQLAAQNNETPAEPVVQNTIPYNEYNAAVENHIETAAHTTPYIEPVTDNHKAEEPALVAASHATTPHKDEEAKG